MEIFTLLFLLEIGIIPRENFVIYETPEYVFDQAVYIQMECELEITPYFFLGGSIRTYAWKEKEGISFWPWRDGYMFNAGLRYKIFEFGFRHYCTHPIIPYQYPARLNWEGAYEEIYFKIGGRVGARSCN